MLNQTSRTSSHIVEDCTWGRQAQRGDVQSKPKPLCRAKTILTASCGMRGKKSIPLKQIVDQACKDAEKAGHKVGSAR